MLGADALCTPGGPPGAAAALVPYAMGAPHPADGGCHLTPPPAKRRRTLGEKAQVCQLWLLFRVDWAAARRLIGERHVCDVTVKESAADRATCAGWSFVPVRPLSGLPVSCPLCAVCRGRARGSAPSVAACSERASCSFRSTTWAAAAAVAAASRACQAGVCRVFELPIRGAGPEASSRVRKQEARQAAAAAGLEALAQSPSPAGVPLGGAGADSPSVQTRAKVRL